MESVILVLAGIVIIQQTIFLLALHKLVNKVMSGNYGNYVAAESQLKIKNKPQDMKVPLPIEEDLGIMQDFAPIP